MNIGERRDDFDSEDAQRRQGSRNEPSRSGASFESSPPNPEVPEKPSRRRFTAKYKLGILEQADQCGDSGEIGLLLRREGLHSSHLSNWRRARREGSLARMSRKRGRKSKENSAEIQKIQHLEREVCRLQSELEKAHTILEVQGKVARLLGVYPSDGRNS